LWMIRSEARGAFRDGGLATAYALCLGAAPFFFGQAQLGMENMPFAFAIALMVRRAIRGSWTRWSLISFIATAHALFYLRPEAVLLILFCYLLAWFELRRDRFVLVISLVFSALLLASVLALESWTGVPLHAAGTIRVITSRLASLHVPGTPIYLSEQPVFFVIYAWPLLLAIATNVPHVSRKLAATTVCFVLAPLALHALNVLPSTHFTRYSLYWWFPLMIAAAGTLAHHTAEAKRSFLKLLVVNTLLASAAETSYRVHLESFSNRALIPVLLSTSKSAVAKTSAALCAQIGCSSSPVAVALQEVQLRLFLDERFVVRSLDGIVDSDVRHYVTPEGGIDHLSYLRDKNVRVVFEFPDYEEKGSPSSLAKIFERSAAGPVTAGCSVFRRMDLDWMYSTALVREDLEHCRRASR
ncbi:MAG: hypothetical protein ACREQJ_12835, partial [Candidatus Binatia bacterium]